MTKNERCNSKAPGPRSRDSKTENRLCLPSPPFFCRFFLFLLHYEKKLATNIRDDVWNLPICHCFILHPYLQQNMILMCIFIMKVQTWESRCIPLQRVVLALATSWQQYVSFVDWSLSTFPSVTPFILHEYGPWIPREKYKKRQWVHLWFSIPLFFSLAALFLNTPFSTISSYNHGSHFKQIRSAFTCSPSHPCCCPTHVSPLLVCSQSHVAVPYFLANWDRC